jgi:predicted acetyltransferase
MMTELQPANRDDEGFIRSQLDAYLEELSTHRQISVGATDAASYPWLDAYWTEPGRHIFVIRSGGKNVGFAFVRDTHSTEAPASQIAEFYIEPQARRNGIGRTAVSALFHSFPGPWEFQVHALNAGAIEFWTKATQGAVANLTIKEVSGKDGQRLQFNFSAP